MKNQKSYLLALGLGAMFFATHAFADNPLIMDQFTADPTARVFEGKIYVYPSHDIPTPPNKGLRDNWFCMEDYHVFSSENLVDWKDHGMIVSQTTAPWVNSNSYSMWAPDCLFRNGKYYFYFPANGKAGMRGGIGVATSTTPYGPFTPEPLPIQGLGGIDPCVFIDKDGQGYIYSAQGRISVAKLKENMLEIEGRPMVITNLPTQGLIEGPFLFERNGNYYLTYPHVGSKTTERLEYAMAKSPMGPFTITGVLMDESPSGCWTDHQSLVQYKGQWYLFYHDKDLSPNFDKNRAIRADKVTFNDDGTIQKVIPTLRGIGIANAKNKVQIDRYTAISDAGAAVSFVNTNKTFDGWKVDFTDKNAWVRYNSVDFGKTGLKSVNVQALSSTGGTVEIRLDKADGPVLAKVKIAKGADWKAAKAKLAKATTGEHDLFVSQPDKNDVAIDWVSFE